MRLYYNHVNDLIYRRNGYFVELWNGTTWAMSTYADIEVGYDFIPVVSGPSKVRKVETKVAPLTPDERQSAIVVIGHIQQELESTKRFLDYLSSLLRS